MPLSYLMQPNQRIHLAQPIPHACLHATDIKQFNPLIKAKAERLFSKPVTDNIADLLFKIRERREGSNRKAICPQQYSHNRCESHHNRCISARLLCFRLLLPISYLLHVCNIQRNEVLYMNSGKLISPQIQKFLNLSSIFFLYNPYGELLNLSL